MKLLSLAFISALSLGTVGYAATTSTDGYLHFVNYSKVDLRLSAYNNDIAAIWFSRSNQRS